MRTQFKKPIKFWGIKTNIQTTRIQSRSALIWLQWIKLTLVVEGLADIYIVLGIHVAGCACDQI
jgi:hypothetical protein